MDKQADVEVVEATDDDVEEVDEVVEADADLVIAAESAGTSAMPPLQ